MFGIDVSNWNNMNQVIYAQQIGHLEFICIKASEGCTFIDKKAAQFAHYATEYDIPILFYHYCRFEKFSPYREMQHFMEAVDRIIEQVDEIGNVGLVLDFEGEALPYVESLDSALKYVTQKHGVRPLVYCSESEIPRIGAVIDTHSYGLWCAKWSSTMPTYKPTWPVMAMWQYTNRLDGKNIDGNRFFGERDQFEKYLDYHKDIPKQFCECDCHCCRAGKCAE